MLEVKASEIVTADKMRGVGPANIIFTAGPNPVAEDRRGVAKVTAGGESKNVTITQAAGEQVVVIPEFDYLVLRYGWESEDGSDFDTATGFTNTGISNVDNKYVGWSKQWATTQQQVGDYLIYGGDNMQSGLEGALIKMKTLISMPISMVIGMGIEGEEMSLCLLQPTLEERWLNKDLISLMKEVRKFTPTALLLTFRLMVKPITKI